MGFLGFIKGMKIEDNRPLDITFRTSRSPSFLGWALFFSGIALGFQVYCRNPLFCYFNILFFASIFLTFFFALSGLLVSSYRKTVTISLTTSRIEIMEMGLFCSRRSTFHFQDVLQLELCRTGECLFFNPCSFWTLKAYARRNNHHEGVRIFESLSEHVTEEAAFLLSQTLKIKVLHATSDIDSDSFTIDQLGNTCI